MFKKLLSFLKKKKKKISTKKYFSSQRILTPVHSLKIGMYVADLDISWLESPFLFQGFEIETAEELQQLKDVCQHVYVDSSKQKRRKGVKLESKDKYNSHNLVIGKPPERLGTFENEISHARMIYKETGQAVDYFMNKVVAGSGIDGKLAKESVSACVNSVLHSPDAFLWLMQLKNKDEYTAQHSLNVCLLSIVLGRHLGLPEKELNYLGLCGMMHDMGKILVPLEILNKPGKLDPGEMEIMQSHTSLGYELLKSSDHIFYGAVEAALTHHERMDGKGYPRQMPSTKLSYNSNIVAVADIYDAITSDRVYQKGRTHHEATKIMLDVSGSHLNAQLVVKFIESLGVYPPGCYVELSNGAVAIVLEASGVYQLRPKVLTILDEDKNVIEECILDLSEITFDSVGNALSIKQIIDPNDYQIDTIKYYQQGVIQRGFSNPH